MWTSNCLVTQILQNILVCVQHKKENNTGLGKYTRLEVFTEDPRTRTGSGLYFKWSAGSGSGPNLLLRVPGLFNIPESIGEHRTREWSVSVSMRVFCNLQFVKLGWEKCEREIRWKKKTHALFCAFFAKKNNCSESLLQPTKSIVIVVQKGKRNSRSWLEMKKKLQNCISHPSPWQQVLLKLE